MKQMTNEQFIKVEKLKITKPCWVNGEFKKPGDFVELNGNDKVELLGSKKAELVNDEKKK